MVFKAFIVVFDIGALVYSSVCLCVCLWHCQATGTAWIGDYWLKSVSLKIKINKETHIFSILFYFFALWIIKLVQQDKNVCLGESVNCA